MTVKHHPDIATLSAFAFGTLDKGRSFVVAAHVHKCKRCAALVRRFEEAGGVLLEDLEPEALSPASGDIILGRVLSADEEVSAPIEVGEAKPPAELQIRDVLSNYQDGPWRWIGPGVYVRPLSDAPRGEARLFLLKAAPGTSLPEHSHSGTELTLVLQGAFSHSAGLFEAGDLEEADDTVEHQPVVEDGAVCICLVAMDGQLMLSGFFGRLMQPFVRI